MNQALGSWLHVYMLYLWCGTLYKLHGTNPNAKPSQTSTYLGITCTELYTRIMYVSRRWAGLDPACTSGGILVGGAGIRVTCVTKASQVPESCCQKMYRYLLAVALLQLAAAATGRPLPPFDLKCEHNLVGFSPPQLRDLSKLPLFATENANPRFSWSVAHTGRAAYQSAFQVRVTRDGAPVWDSGVVNKDTNSIRYAIGRLGTCTYKVTEKALSKKCRNHLCRDALPAKNTSPKTNETSDNAHRKACTDYPHITVRCIYCVPTIPTSFQPHPSNDIYVRWE